ncbi:MAG: hypothetical protein HOP13_03675 [Alphaproteobacteria bacterium]|nr:hypothetical protein [Alphaproteobacteria bacterium]
MTQLMLGAAAVLLVLFGVRVARMPRSLPFVAAYLVFVVVLVGGGVAVFLGASWVAVLLRLSKEAALAATFGMTLLSLFFLWWVAKRAIR